MRFINKVANRLYAYMFILCNVYVWLIVFLFIVYGYLPFLHQPMTSIVYYYSNTDDVGCYNKPENFLKLLDENFRPSNKTMFFLESSCKGGLNSKQACSIESAANANQNWTIVVLFTGPLSTGFYKGVTFSKLASKPNIQLLRLNITNFTKGAPVEHLFSSNAVQKGSFPVTHTSDILRVLLLNKFGGVYLDLDIIVMRSFDSLPRNFIAKEYDDCVGTGIMRFSTDEVGRNVTRQAISELGKNYASKSWEANGPALWLRMLTKICGTINLNNMTTASCRGLDVLDWKLFCPVRHRQWHFYYENQTLPGQPYTVHLWNNHGSKERIPRDSLYSKLSEKYCPAVSELYGDQFGN